MGGENIDGKVFAISGASSGLGRALAIGLAKHGAMLSLFARDKNRLQNTADECAAITGGKTKPHIITGDIRHGQECQQWITAAAAHFGHLDYLINNAGISMRKQVCDIADIADFREVMDTGFWGAAQCAHCALPHLRASFGMIVNISSVQGKTAIPQHSVYAASKHAIEGFFMSMAMEETNIRFLSVRPGWINGTRINQNRIGNNNKSGGGEDDNNGERLENSGEGLEVEYCAQKIIKAIQTRREVLTIPSRYRWLPLLAELFPRTIRRKIQQKTKSRYASS
ncbi:MAG: SDR family NAD(P)-dependent oxidoreductase [Gammaproteobacteria bacterium]